METLTQTAAPDPNDTIAEPNAQGPFAALRRIVPKNEVFRYLIVGGWNTVFALVLYNVFVHLFRILMPQHQTWFVADVAFAASTPIGITMAFFCYKRFVFKTRGNYLKEWLRCFAVYSVSFPVGLAVIPAATQLFNLWPMTRPYAPNLAGFLNSAVIATYSYFGHKKFSFKQ